MELEQLLSTKNPDPDKASELFIQVSDDLSYARTYYGNRVVRVYLNQLTQQVLGSLLRNTVNHKKRLMHFWQEDLPGVIYHSRKELIFSTVLFIFCMLIGILSSHYDPEFARTILGAQYVNMTDENIRAGDPMAVYKDKDALNMFLYIAQNNLMVAFRTFLMGLFFAVGTIGSMVSNAIMVGVFQYYFISRGLFVDSALTIWMHGTMEIASIIIAGGAGIVMGKGLVFPGTYTRLQSLRISARAGIKIMAGIAPVILVAALIEGYITRYTELNNYIRLTFILLQAIFILAYFVIYPIRKARKGIPFRLDEQRMPANIPFKPALDQVKTSSAIFGDSFKTYFRLLTKSWKAFAAISLLFSVCSLILLHEDARLMLGNTEWFYDKLPTLLAWEDVISGSLLFLCCSAATATVFGLSWHSEPLLRAPGEKQNNHSFRFYAFKFTGSIFILLPLVASLLLEDGWGFLLFLLLLPCFLIWLTGWQLSEKSFAKASSEILSIAFSGLSRHYSAFAGLGVIGIFFFLLGDVIFPLINVSVLSWNFRMGDDVYFWIQLGTITFFSSCAMFFLVPLLLSGMAFSFYSCREINGAIGLNERLRKQGLVSE